MSDYLQPKPKPKINLQKGQKLVICSKCTGTGLYVMEMRNGQPWSATGTDCWSCNGAGWKITKPKRKRCPRCNMLFAESEMDSHQFYSSRGVEDGNVRLVTCEA